ncbi:MAG: HD domain-containing protein [Peptococcaceae bacterium]|nr:MAG: HD domain-containing protein [Peptococcaceae bacterium]
MTTKNILAEVAALAGAKNQKVFLVGGFLRDLYLGKPGRDIDLAVSGNSLDFAQKIAGLLNGTFIPLDLINKVARVVFIWQNERWQIDIAALKGGNIEEDLASRDFTINSMAVELPAYLKLSAKGSDTSGLPARKHWHNAIIDPFDGLTDLESKVVRATSNYAFEADPLRILRAIRLAGQLQFAIKPETITSMEKDRWLLDEISGERLWEEILGILSLPDSYPWLALMDAIGTIAEIFPFIEKMRATGQNNYHSDNVWAHSLNTYQVMENMCREMGTTGILTTDHGEELRQHLHGHLEGQLLAGRKRFQLLKLASLFHDAGKVDSQTIKEDGRISFPNHYLAGLTYVNEITGRLKLSKIEESYLRNLVENHMYPLFLFINQPVSATAIHRFFNKLGKEVVDVLLLSLADITATHSAGGKVQDLVRYRSFIGDLLYKYYFQPEQYVKMPALVNGADLMGVFGLPPSRQIGSLLDKITEAQVRGEITTREEALDFVARELAK